MKMCFKLQYIYIYIKDISFSTISYAFLTLKMILIKDKIKMKEIKT